jgi:phenol 2-monooxygenase
MSPAALEKPASDQLSEAPMETTECFDRLSQLRSNPEAAIECQVCVVGAGPAGLMLGCNLGRFGIKVEIVDDRADQTPVGRQVVRS